MRSHINAALLLGLLGLATCRAAVTDVWPVQSPAPADTAAFAQRQAALDAVNGLPPELAPAVQFEKAFLRAVARSAPGEWLPQMRVFAAADTEQRIYTAPDPSAAGGIRGTVNVVVTHALAVNHDHVEVYRGAMSNGGKTFSLEHLPVGKYDLVLVTNNAKVYEGLALGEEKRDLPAGPMEHLKTRIMKQEAFFNRVLIHRIGFDCENTFGFVERIRDQKILTQGGATLNATLRRFDIIELAQAADHWQVTTSRILYREEQPPGGINYSLHGYAKELGNLRVVDGVKDLGSILLSSLQ